jgi:hypothetical protein
VVVLQHDTNDASLPLYVSIPELLGPGEAPSSRWITEWRLPDSADAAIITELQAKVRRQDETIASLRRHYQHDMEWLDRYFREDLKSRFDWCDDGYNSAAEHVNNHITGGYQFELASSLEEVTVILTGTTTYTTSVWVRRGEDADNTANWRDEDGDTISNVEGWKQQEVANEYARMRRFDEVEHEVDE